MSIGINTARPMLRYKSWYYAFKDQEGIFGIFVNYNTNRSISELGTRHR